MPKKIVNFKKNRKHNPMFKSKGVVPATKLAIACCVLLLALSSCTPNKGESASVEENNLEQTQIVMQVEEETPAEPQVQEPQIEQVKIEEIQVQKPKAYEAQYEENVVMGEKATRYVDKSSLDAMSKLKKYVKFCETKIKSNEVSKKSPQETETLKIISAKVSDAMKTLDENSLKEFEKNFIVSTIDISGVFAVELNHKIIFCEKDFENITEKVQQGEANAKNAMSKLEWEETETKEQNNLNLYSVAAIDSVVNSDNLFQKVEKLSKLDKSCDIKSSLTDNSVSVVANETVYFSYMEKNKDGNFVDKTKEKQQENLYNYKAILKHYYGLGSAETELEQ